MIPTDFLRRERGYFAVLAVIFILVMGLMGVFITTLFSNRAQLSAAQMSALKTFYNAESALEIGARLLTMPAISGTPLRLSCAALTGSASITNASLAGGTFTVTAQNNAPYSAATTLSSAETASDTVINVTNAGAFAPSGRILIDREAIDYAAVSGNTLIGVTRGANGTLAASHVLGAPVGQYQCTMIANAGIPNLTAAKFQRQLQSNVQLQDGFTVATLSGSNFVFSHWNRPTEMTFTAGALAGGINVANLNAVSMLSTVDGWAVGARANNNHIFLRWNGTSWVLTTLAGSCSGQDLFGVSAVSSREAWAVGGRYRPGCAGSGNFRYTILRFNGSAWSLLTPTTSPTIPADAANNQNLNAVHVIDTSSDGLGNIGFAVGDAGVILRYTGSQWVSMTSPTTQNLKGVFTVSTQEAWAIGNAGVILRWNGSTWSSVTSPVTTAINAIVMVDLTGDGLADRGFAVGDSGRILSYNGSAWSFVDLGSTNLLGVDLFNEDDAWAVGVGGVAYHWNGSSWISFASGTTRQLNAISLAPKQIKPVSGWRQVFD